MKKFLLISLIAANFAVQAADQSQVEQPKFTDLQRYVTDYKNANGLTAKAHHLKLILAYINDEEVEITTHFFNNTLTWTSKIQGQGTLSKKNVVEIEFLFQSIFNEEFKSIQSASLDEKVAMLKLALEKLNEVLSKELNQALSVVTNTEVSAPIEKSWKKWAKRTGIAALVTTVALVAASAKRV